MKIFTSEQVRRLDAYTIEHEPVPSVELMERAARAFAKWFQKKFPDTRRHVHVFCGPGSNGGDGLAVARMLSREFYEVTAWLLPVEGKPGSDYAANLKLLTRHRSHRVDLRKDSPLPELPAGGILVDAIFGSGLSRPLEGFWEQLVLHLNSQPVERVAVDLPSGMFADQPTAGTSILADFTFSFETPKLAFFFPENQERLGEWSHGSIGLHRGFIEREPTPWHYADAALVKPFLKKRRRHDHKGTFGHALLVAGSYGKMGAAVLAARACLRSGAGLVTVHVPKCGCQILQTALPEAMVSVDEHQFAVSEVAEDLAKFQSVGAGCGIGTNGLTRQAISDLLDSARQPLVLDADALNIIAAEPGLRQKIPPGSVLTPHPGEFGRLFGSSPDSFARHELLRSEAQKLGAFIVLKGAHTATACPDGSCFFNSTGNPGMATAGSGDVLAGILAGLLAQGCPPQEACLLGVYLHGLAGDLAATRLQQEALLAGDIVEHLGKAFLALRS